MNCFDFSRMDVRWRKKEYRLRAGALDHSCAFRTVGNISRVGKEAVSKMSILMIGTDYNLADVNVRGIFSFTKSAAVEAMKIITQREGVNGCVIVATCNRTELWIDTDNMNFAGLYSDLCFLKNVNESEYAFAFTRRGGEEAIRHLFYLCCGMRSQIIGDDQILTQIKDALTLARDNNFTNATLEVLFRTAVCAGKQVKTEIAFPHANFSAIAVAAGHMKKEIFGRCCMVIGNGQMGKASAAAFRDAGARVLVTVRDYRHGKVDVPENCEKIVYEKRLDYIRDCDFIVSATSSPHYTLTKDQLAGIEYRPGLTMIDLAVPRDLDPGIAELGDISLYDVDDFQTAESDKSIHEATLAAEVIINHHIADFRSWRNGRQAASSINLIKEDVAEDMLLRLTKPLRRLQLPEEEKQQLARQIEQSAGKTMVRMLFGLKEYVSAQEFEVCINALERFFEEEKVMDIAGRIACGNDKKTAQTARL